MTGSKHKKAAHSHHHLSTAKKWDKFHNNYYQLGGHSHGHSQPQGVVKFSTGGAPKFITEIDPSLPVAWEFREMIEKRGFKNLPSEVHSKTLNKDGHPWVIKLKAQSQEQKTQNDVYVGDIFNPFVSHVEKPTGNTIPLYLRTYHDLSEQNYANKFGEVPGATEKEKYERIAAAELHHELMHVQLRMEEHITDKSKLSTFSQQFRDYKAQAEPYRKEFEKALEQFVANANKTSKNKIDVEKLKPLFDILIEEKFVYSRIEMLYGVKAENKLISDRYIDQDIMNAVFSLSGYTIHPGGPNNKGELDDDKSNFMQRYSGNKDQLNSVVLKMFNALDYNQLTKHHGILPPQPLDLDGKPVSTGPSSTSGTAPSEIQVMIDTLSQVHPGKNGSRDQLLSAILKGQKSQYFEITAHGQTLEVKIKDNAKLDPQQKQELITAFNNALLFTKDDKNLSGDIARNPNDNYSRILTGEMVNLAKAPPPNMTPQPQ